LGPNKNTLHVYWQQVRKYKVSFFTSLITIPLATLLLNALLPYFLSLAIGALTVNNQAAVIQNLIWAAAIGLAGVVVNAIGFQTLVRHEANVLSSLSQFVFKTLLNKDLAFFVNEKLGALTSRYIDFVRNHVALQDLFILRTLGFVFSVGIGLAIVAAQSLLLAGVIGALIVFILVQVRIGMKVRAPYRHKRKTMTGEIYGHIADSLTNNLLVKTFANEDVEQKYLARKEEELRQVYVDDLSRLTKQGSTRHMLMVITQLVAIGLCAWLVMDGRLDVAIAVFALTYLQRIAAQLFELGDMINGYDKVFLESAPMSNALMRETLVNDKSDAKKLQMTEPTVEFKAISYRYADTKRDVLKGVDLYIKPGEKIGLVGHSGAGKTTITHLLLRFADVTKGAILIGGQDVRDITQTSLRKNIAYVPQEPLLFHRTLRENIAYGKAKATDAQIRKAATQANAWEFIKTLPNGLDTLVGERGIKLSGGQRQRIAIARAILKDAPILLLDEATSALDSESEKLIQEALKKLMKGRTSIVIAHRLSTIARLDRIVVLDKGKITEQGSHKELLAQNGIYAKLWAHQSGGFIEE
jgi:ATP-binding cassette, subfamily B, bacterial